MVPSKLNVKNLQNLIFFIFLSPTIVMAETDCDGPPPPFPDFEGIFRKTLELNKEIKELHQMLKNEASTPAGIYQTNCSCGYTSYMEDISTNLNEKRCDDDFSIEPYCSVITTQGIETTTVAETTQFIETTTTRKPPVVPKSTPTKSTTVKSTTVKPATRYTATPFVKSTRRTVASLETSTLTRAPSSRLPTSLRSTDVPSTTAGMPVPGPGARTQVEGVDVVLISVIGGVVALIIIAVAFFICRRRMLGRRERKPLTRKPTDQRPLTARSVSMLSESSMYENGSVSADDFIFRNNNGEVENGSINGYFISKLRAERADSVSQASIGANSTRMLLRQESEIASPPVDDKAFHFNTLKATDVPHGVMGGFGETSTDKTMSLNRKNKKKDCKKYKDKRRSWGSGSCSSATSSKKGSNSKKKSRDPPPSVKETKFDDNLDDNVFMNGAFVGDSDCKSFKRKPKELNNNIKLLKHIPVTNIDDIDIGPDGSSTPKSYRSSASAHDDSLSQSNVSYNSHSHASDNHSVNTNSVLNGFNDALDDYDTDTNSYSSNPSVVNSPQLSHVNNKRSILPSGHSTLPSAKSRSILDPPAQFRDQEPHVAIVRPSSVKKTGQWPHQNVHTNGYLRNSTPDLHALTRNPGVTRINVMDLSHRASATEVQLNPTSLMVGYSSLGRPAHTKPHVLLSNGKPAAHVTPQVQPKAESNLSLDKPAPIDVKL